jgi:hypothetical protein
MVILTNGTFDWPLTCDQFALLNNTPPAGFTVKSNDCAVYTASFFAPFASFGINTRDGTVKRVGLILPSSTFSVTGSPVTSEGDLNGAFIAQGTKKVLIGPPSGADAVPTWRLLTAGDLPITQYTDEQAQDAVGGILTDSADIDFTYNDVANTITAILTNSGVTANTYGSTTQVPVITVDAKGRITGVTLATISAGVTGSGIANKIAFWSSASALTADTNFHYDSTNERIGLLTAAPEAYFTAAAATASTAEAFRVSGNLSSNLIGYLLNSGLGNTFIELQTTSSGGDPFFRVTIVGGSSWVFGADNSNADAYTLSVDAVPGGGNNWFIVHPDGRLAIAGASLLAAVNLAIGGTGGVSIPSGTSAQRPAAGKPIRINNDFDGIEYRNQFGGYVRLSSTTAPSFTLGAGSGVGSTATGSGTDMGGVITLNTGTTPSAAGNNILTVTYGFSYNGGLTPNVVICGYSANFWDAQFYIESTLNGSFLIRSRTTLAASTTYKIGYQVSN